MLNEMATQEDANQFLRNFNFLHDSVIKEVKIETGSFVLDHLGMVMDNHPVVYIFIQRQSSTNSSIELKLQDAFLVNMESDLLSTIEIHEAGIRVLENGIYFSVDGFIDDVPVGTASFGAKKLEWRLVENGLGEEPRYAITDYEYGDE